MKFIKCKECEKEIDTAITPHSCCDTCKAVVCFSHCVDKHALKCKAKYLHLLNPSAVMNLIPIEEKK